jgi:hypothetical protein
MVPKGRCAHVPKEIWPLLRSFKPYNGGNHLLVALNRACNRNKHALLLSFVTITQVTGASMRSTGGFLSIPLHHVWDRTKNEMELFTEGPGAQREGHIDFRFLVTLREICEEEQASIFLGTVASEVKRVLGLIVAEAQRLRFCQ